jgi:hypothetical protein
MTNNKEINSLRKLQFCRWPLSQYHSDRTSRPNITPQPAFQGLSGQYCDSTCSARRIAGLFSCWPVWGRLDAVTMIPAANAVYTLALASDAATAVE